MRVLIPALLLTLAAFVGPAPAGSDAPMFGATSHRRFDDVEYWRKVFDNPKRDAWQKPVELVAALELRAGDSVADLGAGTGYFLSHLAGATGTQGTVYAVEVEPALVAHMRDRAEKAGLVTVIPVLASLDNPRLPRAAVDVVLIVDTYHHIDERRAYMDHLRRALKPGGRIAVVDWRKGDFPEGPKDDHKIPRDQVLAEMKALGFALRSEPDFLAYQYFLIFETPVQVGSKEELP